MEATDIPIYLLLSTAHVQLTSHAQIEERSSQLVRNLSDHKLICLLNDNVTMLSLHGGLKKRLNSILNA